MSVFFFSQIFIDLIAKRILPVISYSIITYFMIGMHDMLILCVLHYTCTIDQLQCGTLCCVYDIYYFPVGLRPEADKFFIFLLTLFMTSITAATITYVFSSVARVTAVATLLSAMTFVLSIVGLI